MYSYKMMTLYTNYFMNVSIVKKSNTNFIMVSNFVKKKVLEI